MNFDNLYSTIDKYLSKLEENFMLGEYDIEFIIKKLENYKLAVHQDIRFEISDHLGDSISQDDLYQVESSVEVKNVITYEKPSKDDLVIKIDKVVEKIALYLNEQIRDNNNEFGYSRDIDSDARSFDRYISKILVQYISTDLNNTIFDKARKRALMRFREKEFRKCYNNIKDLKNEDIINEILNIKSKQKQIAEIPQVFNEYRVYFKKCIQTYKKLLDTPLNYNYQYVERIKEAEYKEVEKIDKALSITIDSIKVTYTNGDTVKMSYTHIFTPDKCLLLDEKVRLIEQKYKEIEKIIDDLKYLSE